KARMRIGIIGAGSMGVILARNLAIPTKAVTELPPRTICERANNPAPEGQLKLARRFNAGSAIPNEKSPEGTIENCLRPHQPSIVGLSSAPSQTSSPVPHENIIDWRWLHAPLQRLVKP